MTHTNIKYIIKHKDGTTLYYAGHFMPVSNKWTPNKELATRFGSLEDAQRLMDHIIVKYNMRGEYSVAMFQLALWEQQYDIPGNSASQNA